jgi:hypothetical protein
VSFATGGAGNASGGRTVSVMGLGESVSAKAKAFELFLAPDAEPHITCPACREQFDPSSPYRGIPRTRRSHCVLRDSPLRAQATTKSIWIGPEIANGI